MTVEQAMLIVQALGSIQCGTVSMLETCGKAADLLREVREQAKTQVK